MITKNDVTIRVHAEMDHIPVRGNAIASGDDEFDRKVENEIINRLNSGDIWAWASVEVELIWGVFSASEYLGACSYKGERDFIENSGYYDDMVEIALEDLNQQVVDNPDLIKAKMGG